MVADPGTRAGGTWVMDLLRLLAADLLVVLAGAVVVWPVARRVDLPFPPRVALCFITGVGVLALVTTLLGVAGGPTGVFPMIGPVLAVAGLGGLIVIVRDRRRLPAGHTRRPRRAQVSWPGYAVVAAVSAPFVVTAWRLPVSSNDEYMMWALRGRTLAAGHLDPLVFGGGANQLTYQNREYPLGLPALFSWVWGWLGADTAEYAAHVQVPLLGAAALLVATWAVSTTSGWLAGILIAPGFFTATEVGRYTGVLLFADLPVAAAALALIVLLLTWLSSGRREWLLLACGPAVAALYLKTEGLLFVAAACVAAAAVARVRRVAGAGGAWRGPLILGGAALAALMPWQIWLLTHGVHSRFVGGQRWGSLDAGELLDRSALVLRGMATYWPVHYSTYWAAFAALLAVALAVLVPAARRAVFFLGGTLVLIVVGLWLQYMLAVLRSLQNPVALTGYLRANASRVELLPAVLVWLLALVAAGTALAAHLPGRPDATGHRPNNPTNLPDP